MYGSNTSYMCNKGCPVSELKTVQDGIIVQLQCSLGKSRHVPFSNNVCLKALASRTRTFGTGSDARLRRLGSRCSTKWPAGMHSSSATAYKGKKE